MKAILSYPVLNDDVVRKLSLSSSTEASWRRECKAASRNTPPSPPQSLKINCEQFWCFMLALRSAAMFLSRNSVGQVLSSPSPGNQVLPNFSVVRWEDLELGLREKKTLIFVPRDDGGSYRHSVLIRPLVRTCHAGNILLNILS